MTLTAGTQLGRYQIVSKLGAGGMGEVYLAHDTSELGRNVALKILPAEVADNKDRLQRFTQEARIVSNLNHPNILTVYEFGQSGSASFMATEYVDGATLRKHLSDRRLKLADVLDVTIQVVSALNAAHEAGVTHRDLKPENVMVRKDRIVKVLDFGLAKPSLPASNNQIDSEAGTKVLVHTEPGIVMGTVSYMSPEQSVGKGVDQRTDIWSLGVILYEMLAGVVPFQAQDIHRQIIAIQENDPTPLSQQVEGVPERLEEIVTKCLAKEKDERYQTAKDLMIDLRNLRRKLDVDAEIERTVAPALRSTSGGTEPNTHVNTDVSTNVEATRSTSSAEYVVTGIKQHKLAVVFVALVLVVGIGGLGLYIRSRYSTTAPTINSIAVLPFVNNSNDPNADYLSDGLAETLIYRLSKLPNLKVSPTSSVLRYKGKSEDLLTIARELGVQAVLTGRLVQRGDDLSISIELVDVPNNRLLWGEQYERKMADLLAMQRDIATNVTEKLQLKLSGDEVQTVTKSYTNDNEAYQLYLKGRFFWNKRTTPSLKTAIEHFKAAAEKDPNFALAYVGIADSYLVGLYNVRGTEKEVLPMAKAYAERAMEIDASLAEVHATMGLVNQYLWNWADAERFYKRAIELNPNYPTARHWYSRALRNLGKFEEAHEQIMLAKQADPLSLAISNNVGESLRERGDIAGAIEESKRALELGPSFVPYRTLAHCYLQLGQKEEALASARQAAGLMDSSVTLKVLGYVEGAIGNRSEALAIAREIENRYSKNEADGRDVAVVYAGLGENDKVFEWLGKDFQSHSVSLTELLLEAALVPLRNDPRFKDLMRRINLPDQK